MKKIVKMIFGSYLYGTSTPRSDKDFKAVFLPSKRDIYLGQISKSVIENTKVGSSEKNKPTDIDDENLSLHQFIKLACENQIEELDMLHCPKNLLLESSPIWEEIQKNRSRFYTKNLDPLKEYIRRETGKYGVKGSRLSDCKRVLDFLNSKHPRTKLSELWSDLPIGDFVTKVPALTDFGGSTYTTDIYCICGKVFPEKTEIGYCIHALDKMYENFGQRAKQAELGEGVDWKAVSHAVRACYEVKSMLSEGDIVFPLKESRYLTFIKLGNFSWSEMSYTIESLVSEVEGLASKSYLSEVCDIEYWNNFIINVIDEYIVGEKKWT